MYNTQIQNKIGFKVRENLQLTNTDKKPLHKSLAILIHIG